jgi:hypothetical protein
MSELELPFSLRFDYGFDIGDEAPVLEARR